MAEGPTADCRRHREDLSAFADETLPKRRWEQVGYHVAGCPDCRRELADIRRVRHTLGTPEDTPSAVPRTLAERLQGIAGEHGDAPLYMAAGPRCALPSKRRLRTKRMVQTGMVAMAMMTSMLVIAFLVAPEPAVVSNAVKQAREQYSLSTTAISVNEAVGAVLMAHERGATFGSPQRQPARSTMSRAAQPLTGGEAAAMLESEGVTFSGVQRVWISAGDEGFHATDVKVDEVAGEGTSLVVLDATGNRFMSWFVPSGTCCEPSEGPPWTFSVHQGLDQVAGRWARVVEARDEDGRRVARWWVDSGNGLILWSERYDSQGTPTIISGFTSLKLGEAHLADDHVEMASMDRVSSSGSRGWCQGLEHCPTSLAGLPLVSHASSDVPGGTSMHLFYSDGFRGLSVVWTRGQLEDDKTLITDHAAGFPEVAVWQAGDGIVSVATNGTLELLREARTELPEEEAWAPTVLDRVRRGLARLAGIN